jgi:hypothetical protein
MKPDWDDAPEWASYLAMDASGVWYWHEKEPKLLDHLWQSPMSSHMCIAHADRQAWKLTLERRP